MGAQSPPRAAELQGMVAGRDLGDADLQEPKDPGIWGVKSWRTGENLLKRRQVLLAHGVSC